MMLFFFFFLFWCDHAPITSLFAWDEDSTVYLSRTYGVGEELSDPAKLWVVTSLCHVHVTRHERHDLAYCLSRFKPSILLVINL